MVSVAGERSVNDAYRTQWHPHDPTLSTRSRWGWILGAGGGVGGKGDRDGQTAFRAGKDLEAGSVGLGNVGDDGQAETEPARVGGPVRGAALKGLQESADLVRRHRGSGIGHGERDCSGAGGEGHLDGSASDVVTDGIADHVGHQLVQKAGVTGNGGRVEGGVDLESVGGGRRLHAVEDLSGHGAEVDRLLVIKSSLAAGQGKEGIDQALLIPARVEDLFTGGAERLEGEVRV